MPAQIMNQFPIKISRIFLVLFLTAIVFLFVQDLYAKDLTHRLGVGYRNTLVTTSLPSVGAIYYPESNYSVYGTFGIDTEDNNSKFAITAGARRILFKEDNLNFHVGGQLGMVNNEVAGSKDSGFEIAALGGAEFFLPGLDSLGFNFDSGFGVTSVKKTRFKTLGESFVTGGMFFYF